MVTRIPPESYKAPVPGRETTQGLIVQPKSRACLPPTVEEITGRKVPGPKIKQTKQLRESVGAASTPPAVAKGVTSPRVVRELENSTGWNNATGHTPVPSKRTPSPEKRTPLKVAMESLQNLSSGEKRMQERIQQLQEENRRMQMNMVNYEKASKKEKKTMQRIVDQKTEAELEASNSATESKAIALSKAAKQREVYLCFDLFFSFSTSS